MSAVTAGQKQLVAEAYKRSGGTSLAFLDESFQLNDPAVGGSTFYIFTAVIVAREDMAELRAGLHEIAGTYWHTTKALQTSAGREKAQAMLEFLGEGSEPAVIALQVPIVGEDHDGENARRACYRGLAIELAAGREGMWDPIELLVLEERNTRNHCNKDRLSHSQLISEKLIPRTTRQIQASPAVEALLWLPDVVSSACRRRRTHKDQTRKWFDIIADHVHFVDPVD